MRPVLWLVRGVLVKGGGGVNGWKVTTHDLRPPVQGGEPIWSGDAPHDLPRVECDQGNGECSRGWNFSQKPHTALRIAGLWPNGRPSRLWHVSANGEVVERGDKCRSPVLRIEREATDAEVKDAISELSKPFGEHAAEMVREQVLWREALARPRWNETEVRDALASTLGARGLDWTLKRFSGARGALAAWDASGARVALAAWDAWYVWAAWAVWATRDARDAGGAWGARDAGCAWDAWGVRAAWDAKDARDALLVFFASRQGWIDAAPDALTIGLRDAYRSGLAIALPTGPNELGWAMEPKPGVGRLMP